MKLYRIYTEDCGDIHAMTAKMFRGATFITSLGLWEGGLELSIIIEIQGTERDYQRILALAKEIKKQNKQQAVLVTTTDIQSELV